MSTMTQEHGNTLAALVEPRGIHIDTLARAVPSIFATEPHSRVSENYSFIPTRPLVEAMLEEKWLITGAQNQARGRGKNATANPHGAHLLRFRSPDIDIEKQGEYPEIILLNSHDRTKRFRLMAGVFRVVCSNGLIAGTHLFQPIVLTHYNLRQTTVDLVTGARALAARTGALMDRIKAMKTRELTEVEQVGFAQKAIELRYRGYATQLTPDILLKNVRRPADEGNSLWSVLNRVQEHLMVGGLSTGRSHTRPMASLFEGVGTNTRLWDIAESYVNN